MCSCLWTYVVANYGLSLIVLHGLYRRRHHHHHFRKEHIRSDDRREAIKGFRRHPDVAWTIIRLTFTWWKGWISLSASSIDHGFHALNEREGGGTAVGLAVVYEEPIKPACCKQITGWWRGSISMRPPCAMVISVLHKMVSSEEMSVESVKELLHAYLNELWVKRFSEKQPKGNEDE